MISEDFFDNLKEISLGYYSDAGHGFDHIERVYNCSLKISKDENVDLDVVRASALLHDVARSLETKEGVCHAEEGSKIARKILEDLKFPEDKIENVVHCIRVHRFSKGLKAETKEAEILQDADRLDALGANVIIRMVSRCVSEGIPIYDPLLPVKDSYDGSNTTLINHIHEKLLKITPSSFKTQRARELAENRYEFVKHFLEQFNLEWDENGKNQKI